MDPDIASPEFKANAYAFYARLRAESPVREIRLSRKQTAWLVARHDDVAALLKDGRLAKDKANALTDEQAARQPWVPGPLRPLTRTMLDLDGSDHDRLRHLVHKAFTPRLVEALRGRVQDLADRLLDKARDRGRMDLIRDYALPIPATIIAEMLGVPAADRHKFHRWSDAVVSVSAPTTWAMLVALPSVLGFLRYIRRLIRARRADPRDDLISALVRAEEAGQTLGEDELVAMTFLLLIAGHETTVNLIGNGTLALLDHPDERVRLLDDSALIKPAVEELLRYDGPAPMATERYAREDVTIAGVTIPRGAPVFAVLASANRDERQFPDPDRLDLSREPNRHLAFGLGGHYCLGVPLARLEGQIALDTLFRRLPDLRLAADRRSLCHRRGLVLRGLASLPLEFPTAGARVTA